MKTSKKGLIAALIAVSSLVALSACSAAPAAASSTGAGSAAASSTEASSAAASSAAASSGAAKVLKVGASPAPHAEILEFVKDQLKEKGIDLQIVEFTDYVLPNNALDSGELDANYFQHKPYLDDFNTKNGTKLASAAAIHFEPLGVYPGKSADIKNITEGAQIAVPNDTTNEARALQLLASLKVIELKPNAGLLATAKDITANPKKVKIIETEAAQLPRTLQDVDFAVINGNYALEAKIADKVLATEDKSSEGAKKFANIIAVKQGDEGREDIKALIAALQSDATKKFIEEKYGVSVVPVF
ncbi:MetQ/NlpA family ABC transporter substrate-binding protein [Acetanaerobacterium elongatum]|uniref:Lipoprotein n=1 Tax=Acetanaerobacterium elongatum TaxID=258515 RepID=A0A1G9YRY7_9FIRM|nr:MetQ/NlpA family ABC transporter substrate-binding protein [Acetanaerobacterium elongatum]SDN11261.1 D-methionine transport system substrate-binding protein [Acetanaerobacterium elongatum]